MNFRVTPWLFLFVAAAAWGGDTTPESSRILVEEGAVSVTEAMYRDELKEAPPEALAMIRAQPEEAIDVINRMFMRQKLLHQARELGLEDDPEVQRRIRRGRENILIAALKRRIEDSMEIPDLTDLARQEYAVEQEKYAEPDVVKVSHILLKAGSDKAKDLRRKEAEELLARLKQGEDFAALAEAFGEDGTAKNGGEIPGWRKREDFVGAFSDAAFALEKPGDLSGLVETQFGFHIIRLDDKRAARVPPFEDVKARILNKLEADYREREYKRWYTDTVSAKNATVHQDVIEDVIKPEAQ